MTFYLGIVDRAEDGTWGAVFPDLPGCYSAGKDMDDLYTNSLEALRLWADDATNEAEGIPPARLHAALMADPKITKAIKEAATSGGCLLQVPLMLDGGRSVRANISIEAHLLEAIDVAARQRGLTRSAFLASAARDKIGRSE